MNYRSISAILLATLAPAANLDRIQPSNPVSFEANRGQIDLPATYLAADQGWAFDCSTLYGRARAFTGDIPRLALTAPAPTCHSELAGPLATQAHYYRGPHRGDWLESVPRFQTLTFHSVALGLSWSYAPNGPSIDWRWEFEAGVDPASIPIAGDSALLARLASPTASQAGHTLPVRWQAGAPPNQFALAVDNLDPALPFTVTISLFDAAFVSSAKATRDSAGNWLLLSATDSLSVLDSRSAICTLNQWPYPCPGLALARFTPSGELLSQTYLSGARYQSPLDLRIDPDGNLYLAGSTYSDDFPVTEDAAQPRFAGPAAMQLNGRNYPGGDAFVAKLYGPTGALIHSTFAGTPLMDSPRFFTVDDSGRPTLAYLTLSDAYPAQSLGYHIFRLNEPFTQFEFDHSSDSVLALAAAPDGSIYSLRTPQIIDHIAADLTSLTTIAVPAGISAQSIASGPNSTLWLSGTQSSGGASTPVLARLTPDAFDVQSGWPAGALQTDPQGNLGLIVRSLVALSPIPSTVTPGAVLPEPCSSSGYYARFTPQFDLTLATFLPSATDYAFDRAATPVWTSNQDLFSLALDAQIKPFLACIEPTGPGIAAPSALAPATLVSLRGLAIGPDLAQDWQLDDQGRVSTSLGGATVTIAGLPSPILHAGSHRIDVILPHAAPTGQSVALELARDTQLIATQQLALQPYALTISKIQNENGAGNSSENPAALGSTIRLLCSGVGPTDPPGVDGQINHPTLAIPQAKLTLAYGTTELEPLRFQQAPDRPSGIMEAVFALPATPPAGYSSNPAAISVIFNGRYLNQTLKIYIK